MFLALEAATPAALMQARVIPEWLEDWARTVTLIDVIIWVAGVVALVALGRKGWQAVKKIAASITTLATTIDAVQGLPEFMRRTDLTLAAQDAALGAIHHETHNNDGTSIKDSVDRMELGVKAIYERTTALEDTLTDPNEKKD